jgi:3-hydroxyisobutyrate dehydrogenase-like beta-hydroxyacid dehydrogenase
MSRIAILYPGELGAQLGRAVVQAGGVAITCLFGRSEATRGRTTAAQFSVVPSLEEIARQSELVISLVPPTSAVEIACSFAASVDLARCRGGAPAEPTFLDANSVSPQTKQRIAQTLSRAGIHCLDGAFFGPANRVGPENVLALSGPGAEQIAPLLREVVEVRHVGEIIGQASALKMALGIMTKALCALFLEMVCASARCGQLDPILEIMRRHYPGTMCFLERSLPTYPAHVARKIDELAEVAHWLQELGQCDAMTQSAVGVLKRFRLTELDARAHWPFEDLLRHLAQVEMLRTN